MIDLIMTKQSILALIREAEEIVHQCGKTLDEMDDYLSEFLTAKGVLAPPCKVGDVVFAISDIKKEIYKCRVSSLEFTTHDKVAVLDRILESIVLQRIRSVYLDEFGKSVFLSREEAEAALKGADDDN